MLFSYNPNITIDIIKSNLDKPWVWHTIGYNPNITFDFILDNINKPWNWSEISRNHFNYQKKLQEYKNQAERIIQHQAKV